MFINLTCINRTRIFSWHKRWSQGGSINKKKKFKCRYQIKCARRVSGITFIRWRSKSKDWKVK